MPRPTNYSARYQFNKPPTSSHEDGGMSSLANGILMRAHPESDCVGRGPGSRYQKSVDNEQVETSGAVEDIRSPKESRLVFILSRVVARREDSAFQSPRSAR